MNETEWIWKNGEMLPWKEATVHVMTHGLHYGTSFFEGIRAYDTPEGTIIFRLRDHIRRLQDSARIYGVALPYGLEEIEQACRDVVSRNGLKEAYIRPIAYIGYGSLAVCPREYDVDVAVGAFPWGAYLGEEALENGIDVCVSSWNRVAPNTVPASAKAGGNYLSGFLIGNEALSHGYGEGIGLTTGGTVSEGAGENLFVVKNGVLYTTNTASSILCGITRDTLIALARDAGIPVVEQAMSREFLYLADEIFFTGTAAEVTPVRSVDRRVVGAGGRGPVTAALQARFFGLFSGKTPAPEGWLDPV